MGVEMVKKCSSCEKCYFDVGESICPHCKTPDFGLEDIFNKSVDVFKDIFGGNNG